MTSFRPERGGNFFGGGTAAHGDVAVRPVLRLHTP
jgi:hypothetical protein